jgi:VanZ family protein
MMAALFLLSRQENLPRAPLVQDEVVHAGAYCALGLLCLRATHGGIVRPRLLASLAGLVLTVAYGALDEWHQSWVPGRDPSPFDLLADAAGALAALPLLALAARLRRPAGSVAAR